MFSKFILSSFFLFTALTAFSQTDTGEKMYINMIQANNKIYMLQAQGGNIALSFGNDGIFMVDSQFAEGIEQVQNEIKKKSDKPVRFLVNTHFHEDHVGGNIAMAKSGTVIFSHENTRMRIQEVMEAEKRKITEKILPIVTYTEDLNFHFNNEKIEVYHIPNAHTDGDAVVYFKGSNVLHTGDIFFNGKYPFIDVKNGGSILGVITGLESVMKIINQDTKIIPGHGNMGAYKDLKSAVDMLSIVYKRVTMQYINKKTEEEVAQMKDLTAEYDQMGYGKGFITTEAFLKMVYNEVAKERRHIEENAEKNRQAREKVEKMRKELNQNTAIKKSKD